MTLARKIQTHRKARGLTQEELAEALGVSHQSISKWESGQATPGLDKVLLLSEYFQVSTDALLKAGQGEDPPFGAAAPLPVGRSGRREPACLLFLGYILTAAGVLGLGALWIMSLLNPPYTLGKSLGPVDMFLFYLRYNEIGVLARLAGGTALAGIGMLLVWRLRRGPAA